jgi:8-oxo-dGTP diphosphatase
MKTKEIYDYILKIQSIAKIGLIFSKDPYAISNYEEINKISMEFLEKFIEVKFNRPNYFMRDIYPTPNISVRTVILSTDKSKILLVREAKEQKYSLPGGWADLYDSPSEAAKKECEQEAGAVINIVRLVGLINHTPYKKPNATPEYVAVFEGVVIGELKDHEYETDDVGWFYINNLPEISSKIDKSEFDRLISATINNETIFD